ncbi:MAG: M28 family peptidase [Dysgonamonadaceae bacterium]|jgi:Zn-dependent M28 family amino/carboxypeptidase|nr:M28 family peptidase [Dysgonamonadaceae bacterium]
MTIILKIPFRGLKKITFIMGMFILGFSCKQNPQPFAQNENATKVIVPEFNADSAYHYTAMQVAWGPRVPNTVAHQACGTYLAKELRRFGAKVTEQEATLQTYDKQTIQAKNIIASFQPENKNRVLLCAHWDSRPFADQDSDSKYHRTPIDGANDGAGACGALLEIARQIGILQPAIGVDLILFDAEDWGTPEFDKQNYGSTGWCLGSEYWAKKPHDPNYIARYGILLDMVSAPNARFYKEYISVQYAGNIVKKVWETAQALGYDAFFINKAASGIEDDHLSIIKYRNIPCIDIIQYDPSSPNGFGDYWHTRNDNMDHVSTETLKAVGQTVLHVVYNEK